MNDRLELPELPAATVLLVEVGSTAHGTGIPGGEDHDELGVVVETPTEVLGLGEPGRRTVMQRTQPEGSPSGPGDVDRTLYSLRRFARLAASGNPSVLMALWAPVELATSEGHELRALGDAFVGRHVLPRYRGYLQSQARKLLDGAAAPSRQHLVAAHGYDTKYAMHAARLGYQGIELVTTGGLELPIQGPDADWLRDVRHGRVPFDDWWARVQDLDRRLGELAEDDSVPPGPDRQRIESWLVDAHHRVWARLGLV